MPSSMSTGGSGSFYVNGNQSLNGSGTVTGSYSVGTGGTNSGTSPSTAA